MTTVPNKNHLPDPPVKKTSGFSKLVIDFGPLLVFFISFKLTGQDLILTTAVFMVAICVAIFASWKLHGHVSRMLWFTFIVVMIMGGLTLYLDDERFVKMKLTLMNSILATGLIVGLLRDKLYLKMLMEMAIEMSDVGWRIFTRNYAVFMLLMAGANEFIWRTQTTDFWVNFKTFGYMAISLVFMAVQMFALSKHIVLPEEVEE